MRRLAGCIVIAVYLIPSLTFATVTYIEVTGSAAALPGGVMLVVHTPPAAPDCGSYTQIFNSGVVGLGASQTPAKVASDLAGKLSANAPAGYIITAVANVIRITSPTSDNAQFRILPTEELAGCITGYDVPGCVNNVGSSTTATDGRLPHVEGFKFCEVSASSYILNPGSGCPGDLSCDGRVDQNDVDMMAGVIGQPCGSPCPGDLDLDGDVDAHDLSILAKNLNRCCADLDNSGFADAYDVSLLGQAVGPCPSGQPCHADINCDGTVNQADIDWFAANIPCQWTVPPGYKVPAASSWSLAAVALALCGGGGILLRRRLATRPR